MSRRVRVGAILAGLLAVVFTMVGSLVEGGSAQAQGTPSPDATVPAVPEVTVPEVEEPAAPGAADTGPGIAPVDPAADGGNVTVQITGSEGQSLSDPLTLVITLTVLALAPTLLILITSFTRIVIVLTLTRNALGLQGVPPNQVLIGLSLFLTLFVMAPTFDQLNEDAIAPFLAGEIDQGQAYTAGIEPFREFMLDNVRESDLALFTELSGVETPENPSDVATSTLIPAFVISELRAAFLIGFVIFIPFLIIDLVTSASLMSIGMMMLPPVVISLPFKLLLFVVADGWYLTIEALVKSYR